MGWVLPGGQPRQVPLMPYVETGHFIHVAEVLIPYSPLSHLRQPVLLTTTRPAVQVVQFVELIAPANATYVAVGQDLHMERMRLWSGLWVMYVPAGQVPLHCPLLLALLSYTLPKGQ